MLAGDAGAVVIHRLVFATRPAQLNQPNRWGLLLLPTS